jgi:anti-sigma-K factor RskA/sigma-70-like protein
MATFDQLPAEQRAILELVVGRGQTYDELSGMLGMPPARVRELAREALGDLAPATAARVDADWRGQIADYVLGQQTGPEATATRGHFKRSEPARAWAYSLLDSLGHLYPNGAMPEIPEADGSAPAEAPPAPPPRAEEAAADEPTAVQPAAAPPRRAAPRPARPSGGGAGGLSPAAAAVVKRRRIIGGALAAAVLVVVILLIAGVFGGGSDNKSNASGTGTGTTPTGGAQTRLLSEGVLKPENGGKGTGIAVVISQGDAKQLVIQATKLEPTDQQSAYEVWLYNSASDAVALGAQFTDQQGNLQGRGPVPGNWQRFKDVVLSREKVGTNPKRPASVLLRAKLTAIPAGAQLPGGANTTPGGTNTTPGG